MTDEEKSLVYTAVDGSLDAESFAGLEDLLSRDDEALDLYCKQAGVQSEIEWFYTVARNLPRAAGRKARLMEQAKSRQQRRVFAYSLGIAAMLMISSIPVLHFLNVWKEPAASFVGDEFATWSVVRADPERKDLPNHLRNGDRLTLRHGSLELDFTKGVRAVVHAPVTLGFKSKSKLSMEGGRGYFEVTREEAKGFTVELGDFEVVDLGTRFGIDASTGRPPEVHVFQGEVQLRSGARTWRTLKTSEAVRKLGNPGEFIPIPLNPSPFPEKLGELPADLEIDFNELRRDGTMATGGSHAGAYAQVIRVDGGNVKAIDTPVGKAARFDGSTSHVRVEGWQGISGDEARTVVFQCRIKAPPNWDSPMSIISWGSWKDSEGDGWEIILDSDGRGVPGVLRVATGSARAVCGLRYLADNRWHHVAVVYDPEAGKSLDEGVAIYVDGRRELVSHSTHTPVNTLPGSHLILGVHHDFEKSPATAIVGDLANISVHRAALSEAQIWRLFSQSDIRSSANKN